MIPSFRSPIGPVRSVRSRRRVAGAAAAALVASAATALVSAPANAAAGCSVDYKISSQWAGGFIGDVTIRNVGDAVSSWTLTWSFGSGQSVVSAWNATVTQSGSAVTAKDAGYNASIATGGSTTFGFQ